MNTYYYRSTCRLCGSSDVECILDMGHSPIGEDFILPADKSREQGLYTLTLLRCVACGHLQLGEVVDKKNIYTQYLYESSRSIGLDSHFESYAAALCALPGVHKGEWCVDMGSNVGTLLYFLQNKGMRVHGVEPAQRIAAMATHHGVHTECCYFDEAFVRRFLSDHEAPILITANNVFANIDNIDDVLQAVALLLAPHGYFVMETGYALDLLQNLVIDNIYHEHLNYFSLAPLIHCFARHGLCVTRAERVPTKGGSLRVYAQHVALTAQVDWSVTGLVTLEREILGHPHMFFTHFRQRVAQRKTEILTLLEERCRVGSLAAFGASVGATTMLYWLEAADRVDMIVDDNETMHGRLSPHQHIPVYHSDMLLEMMPPTLLNLPWRYIHPILKGRKEYLEKGGRIVQPLPYAYLI